MTVTAQDPRSHSTGTTVLPEIWSGMEARQDDLSTWPREPADLWPIEDIPSSPPPETDPPVLRVAYLKMQVIETVASCPGIDAEGIATRLGISYLDSMSLVKELREKGILGPA